MRKPKDIIDVRLPIIHGAKGVEDTSSGGDFMQNNIFDNI